MTTNTPLPARELALKYKQLWLVEAIFRTAKSQLDTRPIFHQCDDTIRGHVFCSFLALLLCVELEERLARRGWKLEWTDIVADLDRFIVKRHRIAFFVVEFVNFRKGDVC